MRTHTRMLRESKYLTEEFVTKFAGSVDWDLTTSMMDVSKFSLEFFDRFKDKIRWEYLDWGSNVTFEFMEMFQDKISKSNFCDFFELSYPSDTVDPVEMKDLQEIKNTFLEKYSNVFGWDLISEEFPFEIYDLEKHKNEINWKLIAGNEHLTSDMAIKYKEEIKEAYKKDEDSDDGKCFMP